VRLHANKYTAQNVAMTITTALEEAVSRMQLQLHSLPVKRWHIRKSAGGNRHLQDAKKHVRQMSMDEVAGSGLANSRYRGATFFRPLLHHSTAENYGGKVAGLIWIRLAAELLRFSFAKSSRPPLKM